MTVQITNSIIQQASKVSLLAYDRGEIPNELNLINDPNIALINSESGYQARIFADSNNKIIYFGIAGTKDYKDVKGWSSANLGMQSDQFKNNKKKKQKKKKEKKKEKKKQENKQKKQKEEIRSLYHH